MLAAADVTGDSREAGDKKSPGDFSPGQGSEILGEDLSNLTLVPEGSNPQVRRDGDKVAKPPPVNGGEGNVPLFTRGRLRPLVIRVTIEKIDRRPVALAGKNAIE